MSHRYIAEEELASLAKKCREEAGVTKAQVAKRLAVKPPSVHHAEESPQLSYTKLRKRMIEMFSGKKVTGPFFKVED